MVRTFFEKGSLKRRGAVDPLPDEYVGGNLLMDDSPIGRWDEGQSQYGFDTIEIFPAHQCGRRVFVLRKIWCPALGYCASGTEETVISFEEGVKLLLAHGAYAHMWPKEVT